MGIVKTIKGDLLQLHKDGKAPLVIHGANCYQIMGAGIAGQISRQFPEVYQADKDYLLSTISRLGTYSVGTTPHGLILNCYTQLLPGANFEYAALKSCLDKLNRIAIKREEYMEIHTPQIGCGIGGGNWVIVKDLMNKYEHLLFIVVEYEK
jgi:O-acetyl-ADP-ribose deacetylase (regulator of RNase III)